jgi:hypothetical protein
MQAWFKVLRNTQPGVGIILNILCMVISLCSLETLPKIVRDLIKYVNWRDIMALFKAYDPKVEVNGETVLSVVNGVGVFTSAAKKVLKDCGIDDPKPGQWYPQQAWLNSFKSIAEKTGKATLKGIGRSIPENAQWPPEVNSIESGLRSIDMAYHMNHRNGNIGNYKFTKTSPNSAVMVCDNPYPDYFDMGIIESVCQKFSKPGESAKVRVKIDETKPSRDKGEQSTTYIIEW